MVLISLSIFSSPNLLLAAFESGSWMILEPIMHVEVSAPAEYQGDLIGLMTRRNGLLQATNEIDSYFVANAEVSRWWW